MFADVCVKRYAICTDFYGNVQKSPQKSVQISITGNFLQKYMQFAWIFADFYVHYARTSFPLKIADFFVHWDGCANVHVIISRRPNVQYFPILTSEFDFHVIKLAKPYVMSLLILVSISIGNPPFYCIYNNAKIIY